MGAGEALQRGHLVAGVVVDVEVVEAPAPLADEVDELLQRELLLGAVAAPDRGELGLAAVLNRDQAEEVLQPAAVEERVALHVEEDVPRGGTREAGEAAGLLRLQQEVVVLAALADCKLEGRLLVKALQHGEVDAPHDKVLGAAERGKGVDPGAAQQLPLAATDVGDEAEVVVGDAAPVAVGAPAAEPAVIDRLGIGVATGLAQLGEEAVADAAEVGGELGEAEGVLLVGAEDDVDALRLDALSGGEQLAVEAELEDEVGLGAAGELGVGDLIAVGAEGGGPIDAEEEVGVATQPVAEEGRLVDDVGTSAEGILGLGGGGLQGGARAVLGKVDPNDVQSLGLQRLQITSLVLIPLASQQLGIRPPIGRIPNLPPSPSQIQGSQVLAGKKVV